MPAAPAAPAPCPSCGAVHPDDVLVCPVSGAALPLEGRLLDGKFRILGRIGEGGMGTVYRARNERVAREVAIKLLHPQYARDPSTLERFRKEATAAGRIRNPHICDIYDFGDSPAGPYIVMELLSGRSFAALIEQLGRVEPGLCVLIVRQALEGLAAAHEAGIVHRDLKPENIFLHEPAPGRLLVKLMDFGVSKFTRDVGGGRTRQGVLMGTPEYMAPEQTSGAAGVDARADVWSMGAILYTAMAGSNPFLGPTLAATLANVTLHDPPPLRSVAPDVPEGLAAVVHGCLVKDRARRIASARQLRERLAPFDPSPEAAGTASQPVAPIVAAPAAATPTDAPPSAARRILAEAQAASLAGAPTPPSPVTPPPAPSASASWVSEVAPVEGADEHWTLAGSAPGTLPPPSTLRGAGPRRWPLLLAVLALTAGAVWWVRARGIGPWAGGDTPGTAAAGTAGGSSPSSTTGARASPLPDAGPTGPADPRATAGDGGGGEAATGPGDGGGVSPSGETPGAPTAGAAGDGGPKTQGSESGTRPAPKKHRRPDPSKVARRGRLYFAVGEPTPLLPYDRARVHCRRLARKRFGRLRGWRLPSANELAQGREVLPHKALYVTKDRVGDKRQYFNALDGSVRPVPLDKKARVMCVARR